MCDAGLTVRLVAAVKGVVLPLDADAPSAVEPTPARDTIVAERLSELFKVVATSWQHSVGPMRPMSARNPTERTI